MSLHPIFCQVGLEGSQERFAVLVVLVEGAEPLELSRPGEIVDHHAGLAIAQHKAAEDVLPVARLRRALEREEHRHLALLEVAEGRDHGRRALGRDDGEDCILLHELLGVGHRVLGTVAVVVEDGADLAAVDAPRVVEDPEVELDSESSQLGAREGQRPGERVGSAEEDLRVGHARLGGDRRGGGRADDKNQNEDADCPSLCHDFLLATAARPPGMNSMQAIMIAPKISGRYAWNPARESLSTVTMAAPATEPRRRRGPRPPPCRRPTARTRWSCTRPR